MTATKIRSFFLILAVIHSAALELSGKETDAQNRYEQTKSAMGVRVRMIAYCPNDRLAHQAFAAAATRIEQLEQTLSNYRDDSEVNKLAAYEIGTPCPVSDDLWRVLRMSDRISRDSCGAFDVTLAAITDLWRDARVQKRLPGPEAIAAARGKAGFRQIQFDRDRKQIRFSVGGIRLDFGGIGKGFAADEALEQIKALGIRSAMIDIGGDVAVGDPPPGRQGWRVGIAMPESKVPADHYIEIASCGVATSGDSTQFLEVGGRRFSHIVNPWTGYGIERRCHVTVVAPTAACADAMASAMNVMSQHAALELAERTEGLDLLVYEIPTDGDLFTFQSAEFPSLKQIEK